MKSSTHNKEIKVSRQAVLALALLLLSTGVAPCVMAQDASGYGSGSAAMDQDSLPPEVVPLDPNAPSARSAAPAQNATSQFATTQSATTQSAASQFAATQSAGNGNVPGLVGSDNAPSDGYQSVKEFRQAAFNSLTQPGQAQQDASSWRAGAVSQGNSAPGMVGGNGSSSPLMGQADATPYQSQTLTGGTKQKPIAQDIRRSGFSNLVSGAMVMGTGALLFGAYNRNPMATAGIFGLTTMTGFGVRNALRW